MYSIFGLVLDASLPLSHLIGRHSFTGHRIGCHVYISRRGGDVGEFEGIFQGMNFTELQLMSPRFAHMSEPEAVMENVYFKGKQQFVNQPFFPSAKTLRDVDVDTVRI